MDKGVHTFPEGISLKVNVIPWLEFELIYYNVIVRHISHNATGTVPSHSLTLLEIGVRRLYRVHLTGKRQVSWKSVFGIPTMTIVCIQTACITKQLVTIMITEQKCIPLIDTWKYIPKYLYNNRYPVKHWLLFYESSVEPWKILLVWNCIITFQ